MSQHTAHLMIAVDTDAPDGPKMLGWTILSDDNPTVSRGRRWLKVSESYGADYQTAYDRLFDSVMHLAAPDHAWVGWVNRLPRLGR